MLTRWEHVRLLLLMTLDLGLMPARKTLADALYNDYKNSEAAYWVLHPDLRNVGGSWKIDPDATPEDIGEHDYLVFSVDLSERYNDPAVDPFFSSELRRLATETDVSQNKAYKSSSDWRHGRYAPNSVT